MAPEFTDPAVSVHGVPEGRATVLRRADCSHGEQAISAIKRLADEVSFRVQVDDVIVETDEEARARGCQGSPTILIEGRDIEPEARGGTSFGVT
jgi:hypothetical protein